MATRKRPGPENDDAPNGESAPEEVQSDASQASSVCDDDRFREENFSVEDMLDSEDDDDDVDEAFLGSGVDVETCPHCGRLWDGFSQCDCAEDKKGSSSGSGSSAGVVVVVKASAATPKDVGTVPIKPPPKKTRGGK